MKWFRKHPILGSIAGFLLLIVVALTISNGFLSSGNRKRLDAIAARGEPVTLAALDKFYKPVPDASNAALVWLKGHAALSPDLAALPITIKLQRGVRVAPEQLRIVSEALATNKEALALFRQAAALSQSRYPISLNTMPFTNWQHFSEVKGCAQV